MSTFLKTHERLILIGAFLLIILFLGYKWVSHVADEDSLKAQQAQQVLTQQATVNAQTAETVKKMESMSEQLVAQLSQQNAQLISTIQTRSQVTVVQQQKDQTLPLPDLATRWQGLAGLASTDLTAQGAGLLVSDAGSRLTVQKLELVPELQATIEDGKKLLDNKDQEIASDKQLITGYQGQVDGLNTQISDGEKACKLQVTAATAAARKGKWKAFGYGVGLGAAAVAALVAKVL